MSLSSCSESRGGSEYACVSEGFFQRQMWTEASGYTSLFPLRTAEKYIDLMISSYTFCAISCVVKN